MSKINSYDYPDTQIGTLLKALDILVNKFHGEAKDELNFASAIGHKNTKSGGYIQKIADLRRYGFIEKGRFVVTSNGKKIINPLSSQEKSSTLNECILSISLWNELYKRFGISTPELEDFKIQLSEISGDRDQAVKNGDKIRNLYIDAMKYYTDGTKSIVKGSSIKMDKKTDTFSDGGIVDSDMITLQSGETNLTLKKTDANINILISALNEMKNELKVQKKKD